ncbi:hypothetical protein NDU88_005859 [Pleurodeles waltl]|uniref:L1 transposable element RRM domain-containing protein n=1 Tax=Pleurodeles waltl TaxID=8319 RepID=A0AAV7UJC0_PLEWA|nr:hypothetical protein NDU88_005859 [Pleurodeles waltl]
MEHATSSSSEPYANTQVALQKLELTLQSHTSQFEKILQAILDTKITLEAKIGSVTEDLNILRTDQHALADRVSELERDTVAIPRSVEDLQSQLVHLSTEVDSLKRRAEDAEGRSRRNNIRMVGFPERAEGLSAELFIEKWLTDTILKDNIPKFFSVERAHRIPARPPPPGSQPRPLIVRLLNYRDRDLILQLFRKSGPVSFEDGVITAYPDFTAEVQKKRNSFYHVKACLRKHNIKYALLFPARLRIQDDTRTLFFTSPEDAWTWLHAKGLADPLDTIALGADRPSSTSGRRQRKKQGAKPSPEQAQTERSRLLRATSRFVNASPTASSTQADVEQEQDANSDSAESTRGPTLTPRTADDIC